MHCCPGTGEGRTRDTEYNRFFSDAGPEERLVKKAETAAALAAVSGCATTAVLPTALPELVGPLGSKPPPALPGATAPLPELVGTLPELLAPSQSASGGHAAKPARYISAPTINVKR